MKEPAMNMNKSLAFALSIFSLFILSFNSHASERDRMLSLRKIGFNTGWVFQRGDQPHAIEADFDDSNWKVVTIPHDWSIEGPIDKNNPSGRQGGFYPGGVGYYRKSFPFDPAWKDKRVQITFDGVMSNSEVWINGKPLGKRPNGYVGFTYELTPHLNEGSNTIVVRADNSAQPNSRWYTGSGIYRNVWLHVKNNVSVAQHGTYVVAKEVTDTSAELQIETTIENNLATDTDVQIISAVYGPQGEKIAEHSTVKQISSKGAVTAGQKIDVKDPALWSIESPQQYVLVTTLMVGDQQTDTCRTKFGIRDIRFEIETGFWLNGKNIKVKGVNNHHDAGPVGAAVPEDVLYRRLAILKEMGCNAIRTAHNPAAPEFYDLCDRMGFLVMDEVFDEWIASWPWTNYQDQGKVKYGYHLHFKEWAQQDLKDIILRDRNHPSIFLWSVGNEIPDQCYPEGPLRLKPLMDTVRDLDPTRPITCGCCFIHLANKTGFASMLDVTGYNGGGGSIVYEKDKATYPTRKFIATEIPHSFQTRGVYRTKTVMRAPKEGVPVPDLTEEEVFPEFSPFYASSYDNASVRISAGDSWRKTASLPYVAGEFRWTGYDYLGEAIRGWPSRFWDFGIIDLCGFPKDHYYFYQSQWTDKPMVHILPHWTWPGKEGKVIPVWTYSNADEVELFFNGKSLGAKSNRDQMNLSWDVPYAPGTLKAIAKTDGKEVAQYTVQTASKPAKIQVIADKQTMAADGVSCVHLECNVLDQDGNFVPNADNLIQFNISGPVSNIGVENGDALDLASNKINERKAFNGKCLLILQSQLRGGPVTVEAVSEGLVSGKVSITVLE
ncbi:Beta-galactosidase [Novipirellula aureliae]|uniref:Beta-galactosidase n=1 Tax=Novipirellula aureliae TaxID=2527966 RepID=A0A5C6E9U2_9BACT|nr:glycoside hydrolase family 2 TIM barrel-domain containing protein [Novipirellula aureliae]TWU45305.1 Beta-galactosidase [Novipirellula aureliae]